MTNYSNLANSPVSEKLVLCWVEPSERLLIWTLHSGSVYKRTTDYFVSDIKDGTISLTKASSTSLNSGEWYYDIETGVCYARMSDDSDPNTRDIIASYRLFYANGPLDLPWDLDTGDDVHYEGCLSSNSPITKALDDEQLGIALESNTNVSLDNTSGLFDDMYDTLFFENKRVRLYSWSPSILLSEKKLIFDGTIQDKGFSTSKVTFKCKDFMFKLREPLSLDLFGTGDGDLSDTYLYTSKRRIYGRADGVRCIPTDNILDGFSLTGTISVTENSTSLTGSGTSFLDECSPGDQIRVTSDNVDYTFNIDAVTSDTAIALSGESDVTLSAVAATNSPQRPWRKKNRNWHIAGHKLRAPSTTVSSALAANRFSVADGSDIFDGDTISVDGENATVLRIVGNDIVLQSNLQGGIPSVSDVVTKNPVSKAYIGPQEIFIDRDWSVTNTTEAILNLTNTAERDVARARVMDGTITFTNGSRQVTSSGVDLVNELRPRDWIRSSDVNHTTWYEVLSVSETELYLRTNYAGTNKADTAAQKKNVDLAGDDALITVNTMGMEYSSAWIKTGADAVENMLSVDAGLTNLNSTSFTDSAEDAPYTLSMVIPEDVGQEPPKIRDVISKVNESVFGSLVNNSDWELVYNVLTPDRPTDLAAIEDHDIVGSITVRSSNKVVRKVNAEYRPATDRFTGEMSYQFYSYTNTFVDNYIGAKAEKTVRIFLYNQTEAEEIAERYALYNSLSQSVVSFKSKLNFMLKNLNDKVYINFDRLYKRFGGRDRRKIGVINKISKNGLETNVEIADFGNAFNRVMSIADNSSNEFTSASNDEKIINSFVLDDNLEIPDSSSDQYLGTNLIG